VGECTMLNARNVRIGSRQEDPNDASGDTPRLATSSLSNPPPRRIIPFYRRTTTRQVPYLAPGYSCHFRCPEIRDGHRNRCWGVSSDVARPLVLRFLKFSRQTQHVSPPEGASVKPLPGRDKEIPDHVAEAISALQRKADPHEQRTKLRTMVSPKERGTHWPAKKGVRARQEC
jgi:hypothetical protein